MNQSIEFLVLIACFLLPASMVCAQVKEDDIPLKGFTEFAEKVRGEWGVPGMAVGVIKEKEVIYNKGFGYRDVEKQLPVTPETLFAIGSCTKAFTAMAIGMLVDEGKLDLDRPLIEYLPDFRLYDEYTTLHTTPRDLLCHRTGMPGYDALWILSCGSRDDLYRRLRYLESNAGFRDDFQYNNLMYMVAGLLVGRLSGESWERFVADRIFEPLHMEHSTFSVFDVQKTDNFSHPYLTFTGEPVKVDFRKVDATGPAGSMNSNTEDMTKWILLHLREGRAGDLQLVSEESLSQMHRQNMAIRNPLYEKIAGAPMYGQGWYISNYRGNLLVEHGGNIDGFSALVSMLPKKDIGVVVLSNSMNIMTHVISREIYDRLLGLEIRDWNSYYKNVFAEIMELFAASAGEKTKAVPDTDPSLPLKQFAGIYEHPSFGPIEITKIKDKLAAKFQSGLTSQLEHFHFDVFKGTTSDLYLPQITVRFHLSNDGGLESCSMPLAPGVADIVFKRVETIHEE